MNDKQNVGPRSVLVVDDHPLFRAGFVAAWRRWRKLDPVVEAGTVHSARKLIQAGGVDVAVLDLRLPDGSGLDLCKLLGEAPNVLVVMLTTYDGLAIVEACRRFGARAFLSKEMAVADLFLVIERLLVSEDVTSFPETGDMPRMTSRELETLDWLLRGQSNPEIARLMGVSVETVKSHVSAVLSHLGASDRFEAAELARRLGFDIALPHLRDV